MSVRTITGKIASLMRKNKLQAANLEGHADEVEAAFYDALQNGDIDKLMACWADEDDIVCVHPGGPRIVGAAAIRASASLASDTALVLPALTPAAISASDGQGAKTRAGPAGTGGSSHNRERSVMGRMPRMPAQ